MLYLVQSCVFSQKGDDKWILTLQHVRTATLSDDDVTFLSSLQLSESDPRLPADATRIFYTNAEVDAYRLQVPHFFSVRMSPKNTQQEG